MQPRSLISRTHLIRSTAVVLLVTIFAQTAFAQIPTPTQNSTQTQPNGQGSRYGQPGFVGEPINLNVVNADIRDILNYITEQYGVNFVIDSSVKAVPVTVNVSDVPWNIALQAILNANGLGVDVNGNILRVASATVLAQEAAVRRQLEENRLDTSQLYTEIIRLNYARASGTLLTAAGSTSAFAGGTTGESFSGGTGGDATGGGGDSGLLPVIRRRLSRRGSIEIDGRSNTLIITDVRQNIDAIRQLVSLLDQPEPQVEVETRIVVATRNFSRNLGVQLSAIVQDPSSGRTGIFSTLPAGPNTDGVVPTPAGAGGSFPAVNGTLGGVANTVIGLTTGIFGTARIAAAISLAESKNQIKVVATPRITTLNNRPAQIESGVQIPIVTAQVGANGGDTVFTTTYVSAPLRLSVTPQITDAGTVVMRVTAENSTVGTITPGVAPPISTQRTQTEVIVPDGGTTVIGGALIDNEIESRDRTPGLGSVPILGNLFKRRGTQRDTTELLFFITPRIYRPDYQGNPTNGTINQNGNRTTTILQPVPLGNPATNSGATTTQFPATQPGVFTPGVTAPGVNQQQVPDATNNPNLPGRPAVQTQISPQQP